MLLCRAGISKSSLVNQVPQINDDLLILNRDSAGLLHPQIPETLPEEFCRSAVFSSLQAPLNGVLQLADKSCGTNILPELQFIEPCAKAEFLSKRWHAQQMGSLVGTTINLLILQKLVGKAGDKLCGQIESSPFNQAKLAARSISESAASGFIHNFVFRPVMDEEGPFMEARLKNGLVGAASWATMQAGSIGLKQIASKHDNIFGSILRSELGSTFLSGVPGGLVQAELRSFLDGKGWADTKSIAEAVYVQSVLGGAWAGGKQLIGGTHSENHLRNQMQIASLIARSKPVPSYLLEQLKIGPGSMKLPSGPILNKNIPEP